jgi:hypothetical protein
MAVAIRQSATNKIDFGLLFPKAENQAQNFETTRNISEAPVFKEILGFVALYNHLPASPRHELIRELDSAQFAETIRNYLNRKRALPTVADVLGTFPVLIPYRQTAFPFDARSLEKAFRRMATSTAFSSSRRDMSADLKVWRASGLQGVYWLLEKIRHETGNETLNAVANILSSLGDSALPPMVRLLQAQPAPDQAYCLLEALARFGEQNGSVVDEIASAINKYINSTDLDLRQAAVSATSALPSKNALEILRAAVRVESDATIREFIGDEINERIRE